MPFKNPLHVPLRDIKPGGRSFETANLDVWARPVEEFGMDVKFLETPHFETTVLPMDEGWFLRGRIRARIVVPCSRCACDMEVDIDEPFEDYVQMPDEGEELTENDFGEGDDHLVFEQGCLMLNLEAIAWEQFALALPPVPIHDENCRGLCPGCGADLNKGPCSCPSGEGDPRFAVLRGLKMEK